MTITLIVLSRRNCLFMTSQYVEVVLIYVVPMTYYLFRLRCSLSPSNSHHNERVTRFKWGSVLATLQPPFSIPGSRYTLYNIYIHLQYETYHSCCLMQFSTEVVIDCCRDSTKKLNNNNRSIEFSTGRRQVVIVTTTVYSLSSTLLAGAPYSSGGKRDDLDLFLRSFLPTTTSRHNAVEEEEEDEQVVP